ncbi:MAG: cell envelope integrity protein TolA [Kangiellaceae bacterium]|nr:cell envelope integrity protein TolA [Kangiellaceae bacterium]
MSKRLTISFVFSGIAHLLVMVLLLINFGFDEIEITDQLVAPNIMAKAIDGAAVQREIKRREEVKNKKVRDARRKKREEAQRKKRLAEEKAREKRAAEQKRQEDEKKAKKLAEQKKRDGEARERKAWERKQEEIALQKQREKDLADKLAAEQQAMAARRQAIMSEVDIYKTRIKNKIERNWNKPERDGYCLFTLRLGPGGIFLTFNKLEDTAQYCDSAQRAVAKAAPYPMSSDPDVLDELRSLNIVLGNRP